MGDSYHVPAFDIGDSDKLSTVITPILSLGKMLRMNYKFYFDGPDSLVAIPPNCDARLRVELGCNPVHVPTADNLADILTKILKPATFIKLRDQLMFRRRK